MFLTCETHVLMIVQCTMIANDIYHVQFYSYGILITQPHAPKCPSSNYIIKKSTHILNCHSKSMSFLLIGFC